MTHPAAYLTNNWYGSNSFEHGVPRGVGVS